MPEYEPVSDSLDRLGVQKQSEAEQQLFRIAEIRRSYPTFLAKLAEDAEKRASWGTAEGIVFKEERQGTDVGMGKVALDGLEEAMEAVKETSEAVKEMTEVRGPCSPTTLPPPFLPRNRLLIDSFFVFFWGGRGPYSPTTIPPPFLPRNRLSIDSLFVVFFCGGPRD